MDKLHTDILKQEQINVTKRACNRFELISQDIKIPKLKYLHKSLNFKSNIYNQENDGKVYNYQKYKRGSVVMVNFGTNIGNELSGNHFAIVLNKDDNNKNGLLTVVPLTSKDKKHYLALCDSICDLVISAQDKYIKMLVLSTRQLNNHKKEWNDTILEAKKNVDKIEELMDDDNYISKYTNVLDKLFEETNDYFEKIDELNVITEKESKEIEENMDKIYDVLKRYNEKSENSYAMIKNISTISKLKILKPVNKFDPIGKIHISDDSLDKIDNELIMNFTQ